LKHQPALTQRHDFSVRGRIVTPNRAIPPFPNNLIVMDKNGANGHFALFPGTLSQH